MKGQLTVGSLFSGIGGLDLGVERAGMRVIWQSEIDDYACRVLNKHWPDVPNIGDITQVDWSQIERPDVICGGYPCQPFSTAGKRKGENDERHLWPYVREAIGHLRPRYAILENVRGHLSLGGLTVIGELAAIGYDAEWRIISAASVGANHRRDRIFIVAYPTFEQGDGRQDGNVFGSGATVGVQGEAGRSRSDLAYANSVGLEATGTEQQASGVRRSSKDTNESVAYPTFSDGRKPEPYGVGTVFGQATKLGKSGSDGRPHGYWWQVEPDVGRVADGVPCRVDRLRGLGNAVVPQVAEVVGRLVVAHAGQDSGV